MYEGKKDADSAELAKNGEKQSASPDEMVKTEIDETDLKKGTLQEENTFHLLYSARTSPDHCGFPGF